MINIGLTRAKNGGIIITLSNADETERDLALGKVLKKILKRS